MSAKRVKLIEVVHVNYCSACGVEFVVYYVDEDKELYPQIVDICPYCGNSLEKEIEDTEE